MDDEDTEVLGVSGACCLTDGACTDPITESVCVAAGGVYQGDNTTCVSFECRGACCDQSLPGGVCQSGVSESACNPTGDPQIEFFKDEDCVEDGGTVDCPPPIPTVSQWGLVVMSLLVLTAGTIIFVGVRQPRRA